MPNDKDTTTEIGTADTDTANQEENQSDNVQISEGHLIPPHQADPDSDFEIDSQHKSQPTDQLESASQENAIIKILQTNQEMSQKLEDANKKINFLNQRCEGLIAEKIVLLRSLDTITRLMSEQDNKS